MAFPRNNDRYTYQILCANNKVIYQEYASLTWGSELADILQEHKQQMLTVEASVLNTYFPPRLERSKPMLAEALASALRDQDDPLLWLTTPVPDGASSPSMVTRHSSTRRSSSDSVP